MVKPSVHEQDRKEISRAKWVIIVALGAAMGGVIWLLFYGWSLFDEAAGLGGYIRLGLGAVMSLVMGGGLMALLFWSNQKGYDQ